MISKTSSSAPVDTQYSKVGTNPIISLDLFKQLVRDELSVKYRGNRYRRLLERKEEVSAICWHSLAMEGQLL